MVQYKLKPQAGDKRNVSQGDILNNFTYLQTSVGNDHLFTADTATTNDGLHKQSTYFVNADPTTSATQVAVYCKNDAAGSPQIWERPPSNGTPIQLTAKSTTGGTVPTVALNGSTFLPGGLLIQWGQGKGTITFPIAFNVASFQPIVTFAAITTAGGFIQSVSTTNFVIIPGSLNVNWIAIGQA